MVISGPESEGCFTKIDSEEDYETNVVGMVVGTFANFVANLPPLPLYLCT